MKKAGIIGGIGPASTLDYYKGIVNGYRAKALNNDYPEIIIDSINMTEMLSFVSLKQWDKLISMLVGSIKRLAAAGAGFAAIASNTPHIVFDEVKSRSALPLISIVEETCKYAEQRNCKKAVVFGTYFTMNSGLYTKALEKYDISAFVPTETAQKTIQGIIFPKLEDGVVDPQDKARMLDLASSMIHEHKADTLILGCTELPLMIHDNDIDTLVINTTQIHIDAILKCMLDML